jgi:hypothetical protein
VTPPSGVATPVVCARIAPVGPLVTRFRAEHLHLHSWRLAR